MLYSAEAGSAWTLIYPSFSVVVPLPNPVKLANAYQVAGGDAELLAYLNAWIAIQKSSGDVDRLFSQWMEGDAGQQRGPRWSIIRDVLGWVD
jgi:ABC-type amino acid transport substrate-binding protein